MRRPVDVRFATVVSLLLLAILFVHGRRHVEIIPSSTPLSSFPMSLGDWRGMDLVIADETREVLGQGDFLARRYINPNTFPVELFLAYFPSQATGQTIHSPKNCLPGVGWVPVNSSYAQLEVPGRKPLLVNRYVLAKGGSRQMVLYWYQAHGRAISSEYKAKLFLVWDAAQLNRTDGALVRFSTPMLDGESIAGAEARVRRLADVVIPQLDAYIPL